MAQSLLSFSLIRKSFTSEPLFSGLSGALSESDRLGIIGPNGSGKSTLLRILSGMEEPDEGTVARRREIRMCFVAQQSSFSEHRAVIDIARDFAQRAEHAMEHIDKRVDRILSEAGFRESGTEAALLSGGWQKRLAIVCGLVQEPDILLLDEPTNHLDLEGILWLEQTLTAARFAWVLATHDRYFLERTAERIVEINSIYPDGWFAADGSYHGYLEKRALFLESQEQKRASLANNIRRESEWLRRAPKARGTKAKGRIERARALMEELSETNARSKRSTAGFEFEASGRKTKKLVEVKDVSKCFQEKRIAENLDLVLSPGLRLGLLGRNGTGKTTLLKLLGKRIDPDSGTVTHAPDLRIAYFEQNREPLSPDCTLKRALAGDSDAVIFRGESMHVTAWAGRFQFHPGRLGTSVGMLSGGEQARLAVARLMLVPADVLLLDEPTNDLDIPALEALEESLTEFPGAIVLVTHDRYLLNRVCHGFIGLNGEGQAAFYGDYEQWERELAGSGPARAESREKTEKPSRKGRPSGKLSYMDQRELDRMEESILAAEAELQKHEQLLQDPAVNADYEKLTEVSQMWEKSRDEVEHLYRRWAELETKANAKRSEAGK